jgi:ribosomal protein S18 acetylase RimI-like enzyme
MELVYKKNSAAYNDILEHLKLCSNSFIPPLGQMIVLKDYSKKIAEKSTTFEIWNGNELAGLIAAYFNNFEKRTGFITNVSVIENYKGKKIASELMTYCIQYAKENKFREILLEVNKNNKNAISLYKKFNFEIAEERNDNLLMTLILAANEKKL